MKDNKKEKDIAHQVVHNIMAVNRMHFKMVESTFSKTELKGSQHRLLMHLGRMGNISQTELAKALEVTPATVAVALKKLEKDGYISKIMNEEDNRYNRIEITGEGQRVITESRKRFQKIDRELLEGFSEEEMIQLNAFLNRLKENAQTCITAGNQKE